MKYSIIIISLITLFTNNIFAKEINIYSHRQPFLINPFLEAFTNQTGIKTNVVYSKTGLAERYDTDKDPIEGQISLEILSSNYRSNIQIEYDNAFPVALSPVTFDASETGVTYLTATATFKYTIYRIKHDGVLIS